MMRIVRKLLDPSRPDAVRLRRNEKMSMLHLMYAVTVLEDLQDEVSERLDMIDGGKERLKKIAEDADKLLNDLRVTIPENQRMGIQNTADDYVMRLMPSSTPSESSVIMAKDEFKELVDSSRARCMECALDDEECEQCKLYQLLTSILPMDNYHVLNLCAYNLGKWKN